MIKSVIEKSIRQFNDNNITITICNLQMLFMKRGILHIMLFYTNIVIKIWQRVQKIIIKTNLTYLLFVCNSTKYVKMYVVSGPFYYSLYIKTYLPYIHTPGEICKNT